MVLGFCEISNSVYEWFYYAKHHTGNEQLMDAPGCRGIDRFDWGRCWDIYKRHFYGGPFGQTEALRRVK